MKTSPDFAIADATAHNRAAKAIALGSGPLGAEGEAVLIRAARYEGRGWVPARRTEIVAELRRRWITAGLLS